MSLTDVERSVGDQSAILKQAESFAYFPLITASIPTTAFPSFIRCSGPAYIPPRSRRWGQRRELRTE